VDSGTYCAGDITACLRPVKGEIAIWLDGTLLTENIPFYKDKHPFTIPTKTVTNGQHNYGLKSLTLHT
jgi:hypothetical protein